MHLAVMCESPDIDFEETVKVLKNLRSVLDYLKYSKEEGFERWSTDYFSGGG